MFKNKQIKNESMSQKRVTDDPWHTKQNIKSQRKIRPVSSLVFKSMICMVLHKILIFCKCGKVE